MGWSREQVAACAEQGLEDGCYVNLGIGIPTLVANHIPLGVNVTLQSENDMLGMGRLPYEGEADPDLIKADKQTITALPTSSFFPSADSFAMIRAGHIDLKKAGGLTPLELAPGITPDKVTAKTGARFDAGAFATEAVA